MSDVAIGQRLSLAQPNPITTKSCHWYRPMPMLWMARLRTFALARYGVSVVSSALFDCVVVGADSLDGPGVGVLLDPDICMLDIVLRNRGRDCWSQYCCRTGSPSVMCCRVSLAGSGKLYQGAVARSWSMRILIEACLDAIVVRSGSRIFNCVIVGDVGVRFGGSSAWYRGTFRFRQLANKYENGDT